MRMSTVVKEYVKEKIAEKYPFVERPKYFNTDIVLEEIKKATADITKAIFAKYADKVGFRVYKGNGVYEMVEPQDSKIYLSYSGSMVDLGTYNADQTNEAIQKKRAKVFRDIVVQMELGGTKKDLDELLANLPD